MKLTFSDGVAREVALGTKLRDAISVLDDDVVKGTVGARVNGDLIDLETPLTTGGELKLVKLKDDGPDARAMYRHSFSHILAQAVKRLYPQAKLAIGPAIESGFYYDFDVPEPFTPEDLDKISAEMKQIVKENHRFERVEVSAEKARQMLEAADEPYKLELLEEIAGRGEAVTFYRDGEFVDLCRGPHLTYTKQVKHFKLLEVAGAYWRGDEKNKMLQRIYGTSFLDKDDLARHLERLEQAKARDHRRLGNQLDLFSIHPETVGSGLILWHPNGALMRHLAEEHCKRRHLESGYEFVYTPHIGRAVLWETSGHLDFYAENMYAPIEIDEQQYYLKPMNCPFHVQIFKHRMRSYRDLPIRFAEWGTVYRFERSGTLHGLTRVRGLTQDDAHLFCRPDQMPVEIDKVLDFSLNLLRDFGFEAFHLYLSTRPKERVGPEAMWDAAEGALEAALKRSGLPFEVHAGDGAFYGPKIDINVTDAMERPWQLSTIQFDFNLPERFDLHYVGDDGALHRPYMIHRALLGAMERFFGVLIEHHGGAFPVWLAPLQAVVLPIAERHHDHAQAVLAQLKAAGLRAQLDGSSQTLNKRIRDAQTQKVPYMLVLGDREVESDHVAVRVRTGTDLGAMDVAAFAALAREKIEAKAQP